MREAMSISCCSVRVCMYDLFFEGMESSNNSMYIERNACEMEGREAFIEKNSDVLPRKKVAEKCE